ncbi:MAG: hypothetical protein JWQ10_2976 [Herbaspirillum sp.]|jgi:hypothetical protein|nr:hypothetical protein [Herbaspirillum sp.]
MPIKGDYVEPRSTALSVSGNAMDKNSSRTFDNTGTYSGRRVAIVKPVSDTGDLVRKMPMGRLSPPRLSWDVLGSSVAPAVRSGAIWYDDHKTDDQANYRRVKAEKESPEYQGVQTKIGQAWEKATENSPKFPGDDFNGKRISYTLADLEMIYNGQYEHAYEHARLDGDIPPSEARQCAHQSAIDKVKKQLPPINGENFFGNNRIFYRAIANFEKEMNNALGLKQVPRARKHTSNKVSKIKNWRLFGAVNMLAVERMKKFQTRSAESKNSAINGNRPAFDASVASYVTDVKNEMPIGSNAGKKPKFYKILQLFKSKKDAPGNVILTSYKLK